MESSSVDAPAATNSNKENELESILQESKNPEDLPDVPAAVETDPSKFIEYYKDQSLLDPKDKLRLIVTCAICGVVENVTYESLKLPPFSVQNWHNIKPTISIVKNELKRRVPGIKGIANTKLGVLLSMLEEKNDVLSEEDVEFIKKRFEIFRSLCTDHQK